MLLPTCCCSEYRYTQEIQLRLFVLFAFLLFSSSGVFLVTVMTGSREAVFTSIDFLVMIFFFMVCKY